METNHKEQEIQTRKDIEARIIAKAWKDEAYKQELLSNPKAVIGREFGVEFPEEISIQIIEENPTSLYLVIPMLPHIDGVEFSEEELEMLAGGANWKKENRLTATDWKYDIIKDTAKVTGASILTSISLRVV